MTPCPKHVPIRLSRGMFKKLQREVLWRDSFLCQECGSYTEAPPHHIIFLSQGGDDTAENLITLCHKCHAAAHGIPVK